MKIGQKQKKDLNYNSYKCKKLSKPSKLAKTHRQTRQDGQIFSDFSQTQDQDSEQKQQSNYLSIDYEQFSKVHNQNEDKGEYQERKEDALDYQQNSSKKQHPQNEPHKKNNHKPIDILQEGFEKWFQKEIKKIFPDSKVQQINEAKKKFINYMFKKLNSSLQNFKFSSKTNRIDGQQNQFQDLDTSSFYQSKTNQFLFIKPQEFEDELDKFQLDKIIKENQELIEKQLKWQKSPECPFEQKLHHERKVKQMIASFIYEGYGITCFKRYFVKKFLNKQQNWQMLFPMVKQNIFYKKQTRPIVKQAFCQLENFLKKKDAFPKETNGHVYIKDTEIKDYITPLLHCRDEFKPEIPYFFISIVAHIFDFHRSTDPETKQIGITISEAQLLYTKIIEKYFQRKKKAPEKELQQLEKYYVDMANKKNQFQRIKNVPKRQIVPNRSMTLNTENQIAIQNSVAVKRPTQYQEFISMDFENSPFKIQLESLYIQNYLKGKTFPEIIELLSLFFGKALLQQQIKSLHQSCIQKALRFTKAMQKKFLDSQLFFKEYLMTNSRPNPEFFLNSIGLTHNLKLVTWNPEFEDIRKRILMIFSQKISGEEQIIEIWHLIQQGYKKLRQNQKKGILLLPQTDKSATRKNGSLKDKLRGDQFHIETSDNKKSKTSEFNEHKEIIANKNQQRIRPMTESQIWDYDKRKRLDRFESDQQLSYPISQNFEARNQLGDQYRTRNQLQRSKRQLKQQNLSQQSFRQSEFNRQWHSGNNQWRNNRIDGYKYDQNYQNHYLSSNPQFQYPDSLIQNPSDESGFTINYQQHFNFPSNFTPIARSITTPNISKNYQNELPKFSKGKHPNF